MSIAQTVYDVCELSRQTKVPFLFISNPGAGKTTGVRNFAEKNGYHLEVVIGSRSTPEELLGYQVNNGGSSLEHLDSQWWKRIVDFDKKGIPSILFCDEISTCPGQTEGAMLSLIQDRKNQKGEPLPESCIVLGAANYSKNLPSYMDIITPAINRFCVINLTDGMTGLDLVSELFHPERNAVVTRNRTQFTEKEEAEYSEMMEKFFHNLFVEYSDRKSSKGYIDINNTDIAGLYQDSEKALYNTISLRSMDNFVKLTRCALEFGMNDKGFLPKIADGMIGAGSNNFKEEKQAEAYRNSLHMSLMSVAQKFMKASKAKVEKKTENFDYGEDTVANAASKLSMNFQETGNFVNADETTELIGNLKNKIDEHYGDYAEALFNMDDNKEKQAAFLSDYEAVGELFDEREDQLGDDAHEIVKYLQKFSPYYGQLSKGQILTDVNKKRIFKNYKSSLYLCSMVAVKNGKIPEKYNFGLVESGEVLEVGIRRISERTPYKISYNSSVSANQLGVADVEAYPLVFENGKLVAVNCLDLKNIPA